VDRPPKVTEEGSRPGVLYLSTPPEVAGGSIAKNSAKEEASSELYVTASEGESREDAIGIPRARVRRRRAFRPKGFKVNTSAMYIFPMVQKFFLGYGPILLPLAPTLLCKV
jgi:hypothetical protein